MYFGLNTSYDTSSIWCNGLGKINEQFQWIGIIMVHIFFSFFASVLDYTFSVIGYHPWNGHIFSGRDYV